MTNTTWIGYDTKGNEVARYENEHRAEAALVKRLVAYTAPLVQPGQTSCPLCGDSDPHGHERGEWEEHED